MTKACLQVLNSGGSIRLISVTNVVLIPKKKNVESMADLRPISLCNVVYKVVTKNLENRLNYLVFFERCLDTRRDALFKERKSKTDL